MTAPLLHRLGLGVVVVTAVVAATPVAAFAAPRDPALLEAVTEQMDPQPWTKLVYVVKRGRTVPAQLGVISSQRAPVRGLVAEVSASRDLQFVKHYSNCWYAARSATEDIAWCQFDDAVLPGYGGLAITAPMVGVEWDAEASQVSGIHFRWQSKKWSDDRGGLRKVMDFFKAPGAQVTRGSQGKVGLAKKELPMADIRTNGNTAPVELDESVPPSSPPPSPSAPPSPSPAPTAAATKGQGGGGLPVTGSSSGALAGAGAALLVSGIAGFLLARRRRTRFTA